jgi:hypothetical protein
MARPQKIERPEIENGADLTPFTLPAQESHQIGSYA